VKKVADFRFQAIFKKGRSAQKHAVFVKPISCTDRWFREIPEHGQKYELIRAFLSSTAASLYVMVISSLRDK
jgi:hypothetical protein